MADQDNGVGVAGQGGRMTLRRKTEAVMRLLRGEDLELVSRSLGVTAATLTKWRESFLRAGEAALKVRPGDDRDEQIKLLEAKLGQTTMDNELLKAKIERMETGRPLGRRPRR
jgi:BioD-like phosphotransacetylase family protein